MKRSVFLFALFLGMVGSLTRVEASTPSFQVIMSMFWFRRQASPPIPSKIRPLPSTLASRITLDYTDPAFSVEPSPQKKSELPRQESVSSQPAAPRANASSQPAAPRANASSQPTTRR